MSIKETKNVNDAEPKKHHSFHKLASLRLPLWYTIGISSLFDTIVIDGCTEYIFKDYHEMWYSDLYLRTVYEAKNLHIYLNFYFKKYELPKRCQEYFSTLYQDFYDHLKTTRRKVSKVKVRATLRLLMKNISRLKFHKRYSILYSRKESNWVGVGNNYSHNYFIELIDFLESEGFIKSFTGFCLEGGDKRSSMLMVLPSFIDLCNGRGSIKKLDEELSSPDQSSCEIRIKHGKANYKIIPPKKEEEELYISIESVMDQLNEKLRSCYIQIGNVSIPEYFLTRIFRDNVHLAGRIHDKGEIQGENSDVRSTVKIDKQPTIELDYSSLHYSIAAEELGLDLKGKDPYDFPFEINIDKEEMSKWKKTYCISEYNPIRNLKKTALLTMFNASSRANAIKGISNSIRKDYRRENKATRRFVGLKDIPVTKLVDAVIKHNQEISEYFNSGVGLRFQNLDSQMITYCIEKFIERDEVLLPVHDSIIIKKDLEGFGRKCMEDAYEYVMGSKVNCKIK